MLFSGQVRIVLIRSERTVKDNAAESPAGVVQMQISDWRSVAISLISIVIAVGAIRAIAAEAAPYFASMKSDKIYMRVGPGEDYPIKWIYHRKGLPVEVLGGYDAWRRVRDMDGETGWIHTAFLARERMTVVVGQGLAPVQREAGSDARVVAEAKPGAIGRLRHCDVLVCEVKFDGAEGWLPRTRLWGLSDGERF